MDSPQVTDKLVDIILYIIHLTMGWNQTYSFISGDLVSSIKIKPSTRGCMVLQ
jgi:hypothetical protein